MDHPHRANGTDRILSQQWIVQHSKINNAWDLQFIFVQMSDNDLSLGWRTRTQAVRSTLAHVFNSFLSAKFTPLKLAYQIKAYKPLMEVPLATKENGTFVATFSTAAQQARRDIRAGKCFSRVSAQFPKLSLALIPNPLLWVTVCKCWSLTFSHFQVLYLSTKE